MWSSLFRVSPKSLSRPSFRLQIRPWMRSSWPCFQASCTTGILAMLYTCCLTLSSQSKFTFSSFVGRTRFFLYLNLSQRMWESQASRGPWSWSQKEARMPPQPQWPVTMMSLTLRTWTEYWTTARKLMSEGGAWLATFLWTKTSPGLRPQISLAGTLESEHPIQRYSGVCMWTRLQKNPGSSSSTVLAQILLFLMIFSKLSMRASEERNSIISFSDTLL